MSKEAKEWLTGIVLGLILTILLAIKVMAAPISPEDAELIAKTVQAESGNQDLQGRRLVAAVVLNRVDSPAFPNTVEEVLAQEGQFCTYRMLNRTEPTIYDAIAVQMEMNERSNTDVLFFRTKRYGTGTPLFKHGDHYFSK